MKKLILFATSLLTVLMMLEAGANPKKKKRTKKAITPVTTEWQTTVAAADPLEEAVKSLKLSPDFHQKCFSKPWPLNIVKIHMLKEMRAYLGEGAEYSDAVDAITNGHMVTAQVVQAILNSPYKALIIGNNTSVLCAYNVGDGYQNDGSTRRGYCELGLYMHDCSKMEQLKSALKDTNTKIRVVDEPLPHILRDVDTGTEI